MSPEQGLAGRHLWMAALLLLVGAWLRFNGLGMQLLVDDEWHALNAVQQHDYGWIFSHFGRADHSIPLTLWFEWLSRHFQLTEMAMRWPSLLAGLALLLALPALWRPWLGRGGALVLMGLLAISPLLIFYSRFARPYALVALLASAAVMLAWYWWHERRGGAVVGWLACAVLAGWLNPVSLAVSLAPFACFALMAIPGALKRRHWRPLLRLVLPGLVAATAVVALLLAPVLDDWASLAVKSGLHHPGGDTALGVLAFFTGVGQAWLAAALGLLAAWGWWLLQRRDRLFAGYLLLVAGLAVAAVLSTGAEWIHQAIVPARYLVGLLPLFLALLSLGACDLYTRLTARLGGIDWPAPLAGALMLVLLVLAGPLGDWRLGSSPLAHHAVNYFELRPGHNPFLGLADSYPPAPFYAEIAARHPDGDALVVEAPWYFISSRNPLHLYQAVHGQQLKIAFLNGSCAGPLKGEVRHDAEGIALRNFVFLDEWLQAPQEQPAYLVLRRADGTAEPGHEVDFARCRALATSALGEPWRVSDTELVFSRPVAGAAATRR